MGKVYDKQDNRCSRRKFVKGLAMSSVGLMI